VVDKTLILRKFAEIEEYLKQVGEYKDITTEQYSKDWKTQRIVERDAITSFLKAEGPP